MIQQDNNNKQEVKEQLQEELKCLIKDKDELRCQIKDHEYMLHYLQSEMVNLKINISTVKKQIQTTPNTNSYQ